MKLMKSSATNIIYLGLSLRVAIAIWNGFFGPSPGADLDAQGLNSFAAAVAATGDFDAFSIGYTPYTNLLGLFYGLTINHIFVGSILSCVIWWFSARTLHSSFLILSSDRSYINNALLIYALLPSSIMLTAVTLREPYELLFVNIAMYAVLRIILQGSPANWLTLILMIAGAGSLHGGLLFFGGLLFASTLLLVFMIRRRYISWPKLGFIVVILAVLLSYIFPLFSEISYNLNDGLNFAIISFQNNAAVLDARTQYTFGLEDSNANELLLFYPVVLFKYLFEPFPWHVSTGGDIILFLENVLRGFLIFRAWKAWKPLYGTPTRRRGALLLLFISYFTMEAIWSLGTINWGTAVRHHLPALGLLLLAAYGATGEQVGGKVVAPYRNQEKTSLKA